MDIYICIGNSDDKLRQMEWAGFYRDVNLAIHSIEMEGGSVHGQWVSEPASAWQNACWCIEVPPHVALGLRRLLATIAGTWRQDSIAWAEATTEFIAAVTAKKPAVPARLPGT